MITNRGRHPHAPLGLAAAGLALWISAACFSERAAGPAAGPAECRVPVALIDSTHVLVAIRAFAFHPDSIRIPVGASVTWVNCEDPGTEPHTTTSDAGVWDSPDLAPGARYSRTFAVVGVFPYHCTPHPFMHGKVVVQ
ncbi:MAG TPA: plastocyanin/azurin family copper-binding protein [Gemmatimonadales bacterium]|nr:plastocyanin/azurin family copper-binding protein [Gemmatimonadales bacterium]